MGLIVALDDNKAASGELFWDDGDSRGILEGLVINSKLFYSPTFHCQKQKLTLYSITLMFFSKSPVDSEVQISTYKSYVFPFYIFILCLYFIKSKFS